MMACGILTAANDVGYIVTRVCLRQELSIFDVFVHGDKITVAYKLGDPYRPSESLIKIVEYCIESVL